MASRAVEYLERPVNFRTAAKKVAKLRGDAGREGGWIYNKHGYAICQGWESYAKLMFSAGLIAQDTEHDGANGKWYVWVIGLSAAEVAAADRLFGGMGVTA